MRKHLQISSALTLLIVLMTVSFSSGPKTSVLAQPVCNSVKKPIKLGKETIFLVCDKSEKHNLITYTYLYES